MSCTAIEAPSQPQGAVVPKAQHVSPACADVAVYGATLVYFFHLQRSMTEEAGLQRSRAPRRCIDVWDQRSRPETEKAS